jgi:hypothetical protein
MRQNSASYGLNSHLSQQPQYRPGARLRLPRLPNHGLVLQNQKHTTLELGQLRNTLTFLRTLIFLRTRQPNATQPRRTLHSTHTVQGLQTS